MLCVQKDTRLAFDDGLKKERFGWEIVDKALILFSKWKKKQTL